VVNDSRHQHLPESPRFPAQNGFAVAETMAAGPDPRGEARQAGREAGRVLWLGLMKVTGHRGASATAPENTMAAFRRAIELGADGLEFDVQRTSDGQLVVMHDAMIDRTTNGTGAVFDTPFERLAGLDAGGWFDECFAGEPVPRLVDVLQLDGVEFELEFKDYGTELLFAVLAAVDNAGVFNRVKFTGWNLPLLAMLKAERADASIGLFSHPPQSWMTERVFEHYVVGMAETAGADVAHVYAGGITPRIVDRLHGLGLQVHANDAVSRAEMLAARTAGVDSLSANDIETAVAVRDDKPARSRTSGGASTSAHGQVFQANATDAPGSRPSSQERLVPQESVRPKPGTAG